MNKAMTILTSRNANAKEKAREAKIFNDMNDEELSTPAAKARNSYYVFASGVIVPISR